MPDLPIEIVAEPDPPGLDTVFGLFHGERAFDIGANVGQSAESLAPRFAEVISCEPAAESFQHLERIAATHPHVTALQVAVGAETGPLVLTVQANHIARGQLTAYREEVEDGHAWGQVVGHRTVDCVTIDDLAAKYGRPDFIKVDVEGSELDVIQGGIETIEAATPALYLEIHAHDLGREIVMLLAPIYGDRLRSVPHPNYPPGSWGRDNHYWLVVR